jgi:hypothetical protein
MKSVALSTTAGIEPAIATATVAAIRTATVAPPPSTAEPIATAIAIATAAPTAEELRDDEFNYCGRSPI